MITYSGRQVWPAGSRYGDTGTPTLEDIAIGLGRQSRFAGQAPVFYTVLCHTLIVANIGPAHLRRALLLHDAAEAVVSDVPSPWKHPQQREIEVELLERIYAEHGIVVSADDESAIKEADLSAMVAESHVLGLADRSAVHAEYWHSFPVTEQVDRAAELTRMSTYAGNPVRFLDPENAINAFMRSWNA